MLNVSIVLYHPDWKQVIRLTSILLESQRVRNIYWVDNSPVTTTSIPFQSKRIQYIHNDTNLGYGAAHNMAIRQSIYDDVPFHLVVNSDITFDVDALHAMLDFISSNPQVGSLMPKVIYPNGDIQRLCKLLPTPLDVFSRRFLPAAWTKKRTRRYEMHDSGYDKIMNVPYLSGCFMLLRTAAVFQVRLFDERFFMYPEDIDLTRRLHRDYLTVYFPHATIVHHHAKSSYKSLKMLWIHAVNMCKYFNKWGWFRDPERELFNQTVIQEYL
jgi:GT2 family glycosyltransferase